MKQYVSEFLANEDGAAAIEYSLISALIAVPLIAVLSSIGVALAQIFTTIANNLGGNGGF